MYPCVCQNLIWIVPFSGRVGYLSHGQFEAVLELAPQLVRPSRKHLYVLCLSIQCKLLALVVQLGLVPVCDSRAGVMGQFA